jgi:hypothetical protein
MTSTSESKNDIVDFGLKPQDRRKRDAVRSEDVFKLVRSKFTQIAQEIADGSVEAELPEHHGKHKDLWEEFRIHVTDHQVGSKDPCENYFRTLCAIALGELDAFTIEILAASTEEYEEFSLRASRKERPGTHLLADWTAIAIYRHLVELAKKETTAIRNLYDHRLLDHLTSCVCSLKSITSDASSLIGIDEAIAAFEKLKTGKLADVNIQISCGYRAGDDGFEEGLFACRDVSDEGIALSILNTVYDKNIGSDHSSQHFSFDAEGFENWRATLETVRDNEGAALTVERNV